MQPTVKQYLQSIHKTVIEQIIPNVGTNAFVTEQAQLIAASLALLIDVQPHEDDYLRMELADLRQSLHLLQATEPDTPVQDREHLQSEVQRLKQKQHDQLELLATANGGTPPPAILHQLLPWLERQSAREIAWTRRTGFHPQAATLPAIQEVLRNQRSDTE